MAFKTFAPGVLTSSDVNTFLMRQAVITCTSSTRPASPSEGMTIYETDTNTLLVYDGSVWQVNNYVGSPVSYTPVLVSTGAGTDWALGNGSVSGTYQRIGKYVIGYAALKMGSTTTFGTKNLGLTGPFQYPTFPADSVSIGTISCLDDSVNSVYFGGLLASSSQSSLMRPFVQNATVTFATGDDITNNAPFSWAVNDVLSMQFVYEVV